MAHGYAEEDDGGTVALRMSRADYNRLLVVVGYYGGKLAPAELIEHLAFADRLNEGNPRWRRYTEKTVLSPQPQHFDPMKGTAPILCGICGRAADSPVRERCQAHAGEL